MMPEIGGWTCKRKEATMIAAGKTRRVVEKNVFKGLKSETRGEHPTQEITCAVMLERLTRYECCSNQDTFT